MGRKSNTEERRMQIVNALLRVMTKKGYDGATIQAIAAEAGLTPGLIHYHFKAKREILLALVEYVVSIGETRYRRLSVDAQTPEQQLRAFVDARLALGKGADPEAVKAWVLIGAEAVRVDDVRELYCEAIAMQMKELAQLLWNIAGDRLAAEEIRKLAAMVLATMEGAYQLAVTNPDSMPKNFAAEMVMETIVKACGGELSGAKPAPPGRRRKSDTR
ncbi:TetR/AcrR family transcriptional regulator [Hahella sp. CR1]|uniref:TetR/AcrR family transcriptional regulator n=1 Tax=Hahella sp. CR1 TaxID=2992807 RepID=UPI0024423ABC|nr:TetR/AcrR family transcriptional regulator [Hahella sp. CR1]MDG9671230.1 TetR/AcrR family transcriptional regulator [Hahella sp. CR1]